MRSWQGLQLLCNQQAHHHVCRGGDAGLALPQADGLLLGAKQLPQLQLRHLQYQTQKAQLLAIDLSFFLDQAKGDALVQPIDIRNGGGRAVGRVNAAVTVLQPDIAQAAFGVVVHGQGLLSGASFKYGDDDQVGVFVTQGHDAGQLTFEYLTFHPAFQGAHSLVGFGTAPYGSQSKALQHLHIADFTFKHALFHMHGENHVGRVSCQMPYVPGELGGRAFRKTCVSHKNYGLMIRQKLGNGSMLPWNWRPGIGITSALRSVWRRMCSGAPRRSSHQATRCDGERGCNGLLTCNVACPDSLLGYSGSTFHLSHTYELPQKTDFQACVIERLGSPEPFHCRTACGQRHPAALRRGAGDARIRRSRHGHCGLAAGPP
ncbi:hypothetical protein D3C71_1163080 [compost metagenome]